jgi:hypothetical protein
MRQMKLHSIKNTKPKRTAARCAEELKTELATDGAQMNTDK